MYDTDEEIQRKRRKLLIIIGVVVLLIVLLVIFLLTRNMSKGKSGGDTASELTCVLEVKDGIQPDSNGVYHQPIDIVYKSITAISKDYEIIKQTIGTADRSTNKETYSISKTGTYRLNGYVQDSAGHKGKCEISVVVSLSVPECELEVTQGTLGDNAWYRSDVEVGFKGMNSNSTSTSIVKYYIVKGTEKSEENIDKYVVKDNGTVELIGYVIDSAGNEGSCKIQVSKDSTIPTCKLKVNSGTKNNNGEYTDNPEIGFEEVKDDVSQVAAQGVGVSKNYTQTTYKVTNEGKTTVVGYVKDKAGNEGSCSIEISRPSSSVTPTPTPTPTPQQSSPWCGITLSHPDGESGTYSNNVTGTLTYSTSNGASIVSYGIGESSTYNQRTQITISQDGSHTIYGIVKDSYGNVAKCQTPTFNISKGEELAQKVQTGDYVNYNAGNWPSNDNRPSVSQQDGYWWGYTAGSSKQKGVLCEQGSSTKDGWRVLGVSNGQVYLISAGTPECIYHANTSTANVVAVMKAEATKFVNSQYAAGSTILQCGTPGFNCNATSYSGDLFVIGTNYWINQNGKNNGLNFIATSGSKDATVMRSYGFRPVVILKQGVRTSGKSGNQWILK